ncbi:minor capsid protein, partial [Faecalibaculum rodentium]
MTAVSEGYEYWRKWEERNLKRLKKEEKDWEDQIDQIYQRMISELDDEIALFYSRFANNAEMSMAEAVKYLKKTDIDWYATRAKFYCELAAKDFAEGTDKRASIYFSDEANEEMLRYNATMRINRLEMLKSQMKLRILKAQSKAEETIDMALWQRTYETFEHQAGILGNTVLDDIQPMVETIARSSFHGQEFSERIRGKQQTQLQKQLNKALSECLILGKGAAAFTRKLQKIGNTTKAQASRLMRTELARVQTQAEQDAYEKCGFNDFMYLTNPSCCPECRKHDGRTYPMRKMEPGKTAPPLHPNCRCFTASTVSREQVEKDLGIDGITDQDIADSDKWSETYDQHGLSWQEWKALGRDKAVGFDFMGKAIKKTVSFGKGKYNLIDYQAQLMAYHAQIAPV